MYEIKTSETFEKWFTKLKDLTAKRAITQRITRAKSGNLGDSKILPKTNEIWEMRIFVGKGYRVYFFEEDEKVILLLCGGDKSTQSKDIKKAIELKNQYLEQSDD